VARRGPRRSSAQLSSARDEKDGAMDELKRQVRHYDNDGDGENDDAGLTDGDGDGERMVMDGDGW